MIRSSKSHRTDPSARLELATNLGVLVSTVYDWRNPGLGPRAYHFGKHLKFAVSDVRVWVEQQREIVVRGAPGKRCDGVGWPERLIAGARCGVHPCGGVLDR